MTPLLLAITLAGSTPSPARLDAALDLVPKDAIAFALLVSPKDTSDDLQQCIERMNRPEAAIAGRPIDQLKASLGVSAAFDDHGPIALVQVPLGSSVAFLAFLPTTDGEAFLKGNFAAAPERGEAAWTTKSGDVVHARSLGKHVLLSPSDAAVKAYEQGEGIRTTLRTRLGERGGALLAKGDMVMWAGGPAIRSMVAEAASRAEAEAPIEGPFAANAKDMRERAQRMLDGAEDALLAVDIDPLGLSVRTWARFAEASEMAQLMAGGQDRRATMDRLPPEPFYFALRMDVQGMGGVAALERVLKLVPGEPGLPAWLAPAGEHLQGLQFAIYPSKLGIATGGLLNDSILFLESPKPELVRKGIRDAVMATAGEGEGVKREPSWTADKALKSGEVVDAFEVKETLLPDGGGANAGAVAMRRLAGQVLYGSRGFVGFVQPAPGGVIMTFSQRADVLGRAAAMSASESSLGSDPTLASYADWLIEGADIEGFVGIGQFGKLIRQLAAMVPGGAEASLPDIPVTIEPIAFALEVDGGTVESAMVLPTGVLALFYDAARAQILGTGEAELNAGGDGADR